MGQGLNTQAKELHGHLVAIDQFRQQGVGNFLPITDEQMTKINEVVCNHLMADALNIVEPLNRRVSSVTCGADRGDRLLGEVCESRKYYN